jgi:hypothetical protein
MLKQVVRTITIKDEFMFTRKLALPSWRRVIIPPTVSLRVAEGNEKGTQCHLSLWGHKYPGTWSSSFDARLTKLLCVKFIITKPKELKIGWSNLDKYGRIL